MKEKINTRSIKKQLLTCKTNNIIETYSLIKVKSPKQKQRMIVNINQTNESLKIFNKNNSDIKNSKYQ